MMSCIQLVRSHGCKTDFSFPAQTTHFPRKLEVYSRLKEDLKTRSILHRVYMMRKRDYGASSRGGGGGDIISGLPDAILLQILSLLDDMKYAVQTSVLSKRWRYLWASLRKLVFNEELFQSPNKNGFIRFKNFVDQVLILRENSDIDMFRLTSTSRYGDIRSYLDIWILAVTRRKVQKLILSLWDEGIRLPTCLSTCTSLTELVLVMGGSRRWRINLPKSMDLPNLKVLKLGFLVFHDENLTNNFFSCCLNLEVLSMEDVEFQRMNVNMCALNLQEFTVENHCHANYYGYFRRSINTKFKLYAPNLRYICYNDYMFDDYILENLSSLVHANIDMKLVEKDEEPGIYSTLGVEYCKQMYAQRLMQFLKGLQYVEDLKLSAWCLETVSGSPDLLNSQQTKFCDLTCLALKTCLARDNIRAIMYLLKISPVLESLSLEISKIQIASTNIDHYWEEVLPLHNLKFVTIRGVVGCVNELKFLEVLLKSAEVLENLKIFTSKESLPADREKCLMKYSDKLSTLPRASSNITIMVF